MSDFKPISEYWAGIELGRLGPVVHQLYQDLYRVLVQEENDTYLIHTGDRMKRVFQQDELPEDIKSKITMIRAYAAKPSEMLTDEQFAMSSAGLFNNRFFPPEYDDIGWQISPSWYVLIIGADLLCELRGEARGSDLHGGDDGR